jgi:hypothetical protein
VIGLLLAAASILVLLMFRRGLSQPDAR